MAQIVGESSVPGSAGPQSTDEQKSWRFGRILLEAAREESRYRTNNFYDEWKFTLGENHWPAPESYRALRANKWQSQTVRNWLWATIDQKAAIVLDADPQIHVEPLSEQVGMAERAKIAQAIGHELDRLNWSRRIEDCFLDGCVTGKGIIFIRYKRDKISGRYYICMENVDPNRFYPDPSASRLEDCRYVVHEPIMDMSVVRQIFPDKADQVKATISTDLYRYQDNMGYTRTDQDLIEGNSGSEYVVGKDGIIRSRKAEVAFIWVKDDEIEIDIDRANKTNMVQGFRCMDCGSEFEAGEAKKYLLDGMQGDVTTMCPECGGQNLVSTMIEVGPERMPSMKRKYPFGRLIVISGNTLLYDGENPMELEGVFPFVEYNHYRVPRRFWGYGDTALLKSSQRVADKTMAQGIDYLRVAANGPFEVPSQAEAYLTLGTGPGQIVPVAEHLIGMAHYVTPQGFDKAMFQMVNALCMEDFHRVSGVSDVSRGLIPTGASSGVEVEARQRAASTRIGLHLKRLNQTRSDVASIVWQLMNQLYVGERSYGMSMIMGAKTTSEAIAMDVSMMPRNVRVMVTADPDDLAQDKLTGQNLAMSFQNGLIFLPQMQPFLDIYLNALGLGHSKAQEVQRRILMIQEQMAAEGGGAGDAMAEGEAPLANGQGGPPSPVNGAANGQMA